MRIASFAERDQLAREIGAVLIAPDGNGAWILYEPGDELPQAPAPEPQPRILMQTEFLSRISPSMRNAMIAGAVGNPQLLAVVLNMLTAPELHPDSPEFQMGIAAFVAAGLITQQQADELSA